MKCTGSALIIGFVITCNLLTASPLQAQRDTSPQTQGASSSDEDLNIQAYVQLLRTDLRNNKSQIIGQVMQLDATQAAKFWPIYKQFESDYTKVGDRIVGLIKRYVDNYGRMTDPVADKLCTELLSIERQRNDLNRQYYQKFKEALGAITAARFLQVENQLEKVLDLQIASHLPVIAKGEGQ